MTFSKMDYSILRAIAEKDDNSTDTNKGLSRLNGTSYKELQNKTGASQSKIQKTITKFIKAGFVEQGINDGRNKTFILTLEGINEINDVQKSIIEFEEDDE